MSHQKRRWMPALSLPFACVLIQASYGTSSVACYARPGLASEGFYRIQEEVSAGKVLEQIDRINRNCTQRRELGCTVVERGFTTISGRPIGQITMRLLPAAMAVIAATSAAEAKITKQEHIGNERQHEDAQVEADIAQNVENQKRINALLERSATDLSRRIDLVGELASAEEQFARLQMNLGRQREHRATLIIHLSTNAP